MINDLPFPLTVPTMSEADHELARNNYAAYITACNHPLASRPKGWVPPKPVEPTDYSFSAQFERWSIQQTDPTYGQPCTPDFDTDAHRLEENY